MLRIHLSYPKPVDEVVILDEQKRQHPIDALEEVCPVEELREMQRAVREIYVDPTVAEYIVRLVNGTRDHGDIYLGASPRGSIALYPGDYFYWSDVGACLTLERLSRR